MKCLCVVIAREYEILTSRNFRVFAFAPSRQIHSIFVKYGRLYLSKRLQALTACAVALSPTRLARSLDGGRRCTDGDNARKMTSQGTTDTNSRQDSFEWWSMVPFSTLITGSPSPCGGVMHRPAVASGRSSVCTLSLTRRLRAPTPWVG